MEKNIKLLFGLIGGLTLFFINRIFSGHAFLGGLFGFVLNNVIMRVLSFIGLISVEVIAIFLIIDAAKFLFKSQKD